MLDAASLARARAQVGIPSPMSPAQSLLKNRTSTLDTAWSAPKMAMSTPQSAPRSPVMDALVSGSKKFVAGGVPGLFSPETPSTFKDALREGIKSRGDSLKTQLAFDPANPEESGLTTTLGGFAGGTAPVKKLAEKAAPAVFDGFQDLSTKLLEKLKGKSVTSKQEIADFTNAPDLKQAEKDLFRRMLEDEGDKIDIPTFANKVKSELLPLTTKKSPSGTGRYESINLPEELRGPVANYEERIYESPIKTSAGRVHFGDDMAEESLSGSDSYFAHSRIEDLPSPGTKMDNDTGLAYDEVGNVSTPKSGTTRRVIEIQSDLFQKGRLEKEVPSYLNPTDYLPKNLRDELQKTSKQILDIESPNNIRGIEPYKAELAELKARREGILAQAKPAQDKAIADRTAETAKLEPYRNTWHERVIREEVKQAAKDGKTKLQFPTGETAMKIEGLVNRSDKWVTLDNKLVDGTNIKDGDLITYQTHEGTPHEDRRFLITKNKGDGTFEAVDGLTAENDSDLYNLLDKKGFLDDGRMPSLEELDGVGALADKEIKAQLSKLSEQLSAKDVVDTENPIFKFYEKNVQKYLTNKYGGKVITDPQGVKWVEIDVKPEFKGLPVEAFGAGALPFLNQDDYKQKNSTPSGV